ncbi:MAG TPA: STAS domain-containing protein [Isosphaeraceae bacterium]|nr:STAS domain-containing protein [Isosphaeraceae bacterium]
MIDGEPVFQFLSLKEVDGVAVITLLESASIIEGDKVDALTKELFDLLEDKQFTNILLNLFHASYMSSAMLAQFVRLHRKMQNLKGRVRLCCLQPSVMDAFKVSQFDRLFEIFGDELTALKEP